MKKLFLILLFTSVLCAQNQTEKYVEAITAYHQSNFVLAKNLLEEVKREGKLDAQGLANLHFMIADCSLNLDQLDAAAIELENFLAEFHLNNYRTSALYKLGTIYYYKREYRKARERMTSLTTEYPFSEFHGSAFYWIAEAYVAENKFVEAEENFREAISNKKTNKFIVNSYYSLAQLYERTNDFNSAVASYDELLTFYKDTPLAIKSQLRIAICYYQLNDYNNAILELTDPGISKLTPEDAVEADFYLANAHARLAEYNEASEILTRMAGGAITSSMLNRVNFSLAWIEFQQAKYNDSYKRYQQVYESADDSLKILSLFWSGECKRYQGDEKSADALFKEFIDKYPEHRLASKAQLGRGSVFVSQNNTGDAESALLNATLSKDKTTKTKAYTMLGELRLNNKRYGEAKKYFTEAIRLKPDQKDLSNRSSLGLGVSCFYLNEYIAAETNLLDLKEHSKDFESDKVNFYLAEIYFSQGKYSAALKYYNLIKSSDKQIVKQTTLGKSYAYFNMKDFGNAIANFNQYSSSYPNDPAIKEIKMHLADSYFGSKKFDKAAEIYRDLFKDRTTLNNDLAFYQYAQSLFKAGKTEDAKSAFRELQQKFPKSKYTDRSQYVIGWIDFQKNNFDGAIHEYLSLLNRYPRSELKPIAYYSIGDALFNKADYDSAIVYYSKVLTEFPNTQYIFDAVNGIQYSYVAKEQPEQAIVFIDNFVSLNPNSKFGDQIYFKKGDLYYSIQKYDAAVSAYSDFISRYPNSPLVANAQYWIGKSAFSLKKEKDAINWFSYARQKAPKSDVGISATVDLAQIYSTSKKYDDAIKILEETIAVNSSSNRIPELLYLQGTNELKANKLPDAQSTFEQITNYYENSIFGSKAKLEIGKISIQQKNYERAQQLLKEVGDKRSDDIGAEAQYYYGLSLFYQNRFDEAITAFVRTRSVFSAYDEWYTKSVIKLGDCFVKIKDKKQAREMYKAVLSRHVDDEFAVEAKRKLRGL